MKMIFILFTALLCSTAFADKVCLSGSKITSELQLLANSTGWSGTLKGQDTVSAILPSPYLAYRINRSAGFSRAGLNLSPEDIWDVRTVGELAGVIKWSLCSSK